MGPSASDRVALVVAVFAGLLIVLAIALVAHGYARRRDREARKAERIADREFIGGLTDRIVLAIGAESRARVEAERKRLYP